MQKPTTTKLKQIKFLANRKPAEAKRLLTNEDYFRSCASIMNLAKSFVQGKAIDRLKIVADISSGKNARNEAIELSRNVAKLLILTILRNNNQKNLADQLEIISAVIDNLRQNGNIRAQLTFLALNV